MGTIVQAQQEFLDWHIACTGRTGMIALARAETNRTTPALRLLAKENWDEHYDPIWGGVVFLPGPTTWAPEAGHPIEFLVAFNGGPRFALSGIVCWRRLKGHEMARPGVGVLVAPSLRSRLDYITRFARGELPERRRSRRTATRI